MDLSRITLRRFKLSDVDDFFKWISDERVAPNVRFGPITSREQALEFIQNVALPHPWLYSICLDDRSIGYVGVWQHSGDDIARANIGLALGAECWGNGVGPHALRMALAKAFKDIPGLLRIECGTLLDNIKSQKMLEKVGFLREGLLRQYTKYQGVVRDFYIYSILSTDKILPSSRL